MEYNSINFLVLARATFINWFWYCGICIGVKILALLCIQFHHNSYVQEFGIYTYKMDGKKLMIGQLTSGYLELVICTLISLSANDFEYVWEHGTISDKFSLAMLILLTIYTITIPFFILYVVITYFD